MSGLIEPELKRRALEARMRAGDLFAFLVDMAMLARDPAYYYTDEKTVAALEPQRLAVATELEDATEHAKEIHDVLTNLTMAGEALSFETERR